MANLSHHSAARKEYGASVKWYRARSIDAAYRFVQEVEAAFELISNHPDRYPKVNPRSRFREIILEKYPFSIIYETSSPGEVRIIAIAHSSRNRGYWNRRK